MLSALSCGGLGSPPSDPSASLVGYMETFPGEYGLRNSIRGDGYFNIDSGVSKTFRMPWKEGHTLQIRWETFNVTNSVKFGSASMSLTDTGNWGKLSSMLNSPRQMQFAVRYVF